MEEDTDKEMDRTVTNSIAEMIRSHTKIMELKRIDSEDINYCMAIKRLLSVGVISCGKKNSDCFERYDGIMYIRYPTLISALNREYSINVTAKKLSLYFSGLGISQGYNSRCNKKKVKKYGGKNYLVLDMEKLNEEAWRSKDPIEKIL